VRNRFEGDADRRRPVDPVAFEGGIEPVRPWALDDAQKDPLERFPITWNHVIEKKSLKIKELEHVLIEKVEKLFRDML